MWSSAKMEESESHSVMSDFLQPHGSDSPWNSPGQNTGVGSPSLLQGIFPTQGSSPGLRHCRWIHNQLSHEGSPRILECVAYPFSSGSSRHGNGNGVSCITGGFFTNELSGKSKSVSLSGVCVCKWDIWYMWQVPRYVWICVNMHVCLSLKFWKSLSPYSNKENLDILEQSQLYIPPLDERIVCNNAIWWKNRQINLIRFSE